MRNTLSSRKLRRPAIAGTTGNVLQTSRDPATLTRRSNATLRPVRPSSAVPLQPLEKKAANDHELLMPSLEPVFKRAAPSATVSKLQHSENPFGHAVTIAVSVRDNQATLGEISLTISEFGDLSVPLAELLSLLGNRITHQERERLISLALANGQVSLEKVNWGATKLTFDKRNIELQLAITEPGEDGTVISVSPPIQGGTENLARPAELSMYITLRSAMDYVRHGSEAELRSPLIGSQYAVRFGGVVVEGEQQYNSNSIGSPWSRLGTRAVVDLLRRNVRIVAGDTQSHSVGFQQAANVVGVSLGRQYRLFDPSRNIFPTSLDSFVLAQASDVEILVNGATVRRVLLAPGRYNLEDFPFVRGSNDVQVRAVDMLGRPEIARFNRYFDLDLLRPGLSEFNATAGFISTPGPSAPVYDFARPIVAGFYRRGLTNQLTAGLNVQADKNARQIGAQAVLATSLGEFGFTGAISQERQRGVGSAIRVDFQRVNPSAKQGGHPQKPLAFGAMI